MLHKFVLKQQDAKSATKQKSIDLRLQESITNETSLDLKLNKESNILKFQQLR